jgi:hypothetical protein
MYQMILINILINAPRMADPFMVAEFGSCHPHRPNAEGNGSFAA